VDYLNAAKAKGFNPDVSYPPPKTDADFGNLDYLYELFKHRALITVYKVERDLSERASKVGASFDEEWNRSALELLNAVRAHCFYFLFTNFRLVIDRETDVPVKNALTRLCALYATSNMLDEPSWIGFLDRQQTKRAKDTVSRLLDEIRPDLVPLVDAFDYSDTVLNSVIGRHDGNVYEALYESARRSPLNKVDPFDGYKEYLQPHLDIELLTEGAKKAAL